MGVLLHLVHDLSRKVLEMACWRGPLLCSDKLDVLLVQLQQRVDAVIKPHPGADVRVSVLTG